MFRSKKIAVLAAGAVAALALGSFAFAAIPDGNGVIHACFNKNSGAVRVTDTATNLPQGCSSKEAALDWNQQGPKGDRGPSNTYVKEFSLTTIPANTWTTVTSRTLPPGHYAISAKLVAEADGLNVPPSQVTCALGAGSAKGSSNDLAIGTVSSDGTGSVLVSTLALANDNTGYLVDNGGTVSVGCHSPHAAKVLDTKITAIQVESVDYQ